MTIFSQFFRNYWVILKQPPLAGLVLLILTGMLVVDGPLRLLPGMLIGALIGVGVAAVYFIYNPKPLLDRE